MIFAMDGCEVLGGFNLVFVELVAEFLELAKRVGDEMELMFIFVASILLSSTELRFMNSHELC